MQIEQGTIQENGVVSRSIAYPVILNSFPAPIEVCEKVIQLSEKKEEKLRKEAKSRLKSEARSNDILIVDMENKRAGLLRSRRVVIFESESFVSVCVCEMDDIYQFNWKQTMELRWSLEASCEWQKNQNQSEYKKTKKLQQVKLDVQRVCKTKYSPFHIEHANIEDAFIKAVEDKLQCNTNSNTPNSNGSDNTSN